jgi:hypothetical protein
MASTSSPYGFQPISDQSGPAIRTARIPFGITSGYATNIFKGQPVTMNPATGTIQAVTAANQQIYGIMNGVEFTPLGGRPLESPFWPGGAVVDTRFDFLVYIIPAWVPSYRFRVQADGSVGQPALGSQFNLSNFTAGNTSTGLSAATVAAAGVAAGVQGQFFFTEFFDTTGVYGTIGDAFTDMIVGISYQQVGAGFQPSIG